MPLENYNDLIESVASFLGRDDLHNEIADFVRLAELRLQRDLQMPIVENTATGNFVAAQAYINQPASFLEPRAFWLDTSEGPVPLEPVGTEKLAALRKLDSGTPQAFMVYGTRLELAPIPGGTDAYTLLYLGGMTRLSEDNATNWLLTNGADALLYGALLISQLYLGAHQNAQTWLAAFTAAMESLGRQAWRARVGGAPLRTRPLVVV